MCTKQQIWGTLQTLSNPNFSSGPAAIRNRQIILYKHYLWLASIRAFWKPLTAALWKMGASKPRKSAPTLLKERPKYIHWPRMESNLPPTSCSRSASSVVRNWDICSHKRMLKPSFSCLSDRGIRGFPSAWKTLSFTSSLWTPQVFTNKIHRRGVPIVTSVHGRLPV